MKSTIKWSRLAAAAAALGGMLATGSAQAVIVYSGLVNLAIPSTVAGLYVNVLNGTSFSGPGVFPTLPGPGSNFDFNLFGTASWSFFSPTASGQSAPGVPDTSKGYVSASATGAGLNLAPGTLISGASVFNVGSPSAAALTTGAPAIFGFRFRNEGPDLNVATDDTVHFGWARVRLTAGVPGTLIDYAFESVPLTGIQAGVVPEPGTWMLMGLGVAGLVLAQKRKRAA